MLFTPPSPPPQLPKQVVVWVHGTRPQELFPSIKIKNILADLRLHLSFCPPGLHTPEELQKDDLHVYTVAQTLNEVDPEYFAKGHVYLFGWSGKLDPDERKKAAHELHEALKTLRDTYIKQYGTCPPFMVITHSHGANVALNLATIENNDIVIDKLVLLAGPVQKETIPFVSSPLFKKVYSIHSHYDTIQILDPQGLHPIEKAVKTAWKEKSWDTIKSLFNGNNRRKKLFSARHFPYYNNVIQAAVEWKEKAPWAQEDLAVFGYRANLVKKLAKVDISKRGLLHVEFLLPTFIKKLPNMIDYLSKCSPICSDINPDIVIQL